MKIGKIITKNSLTILIISTILLIPSVLGFLNTEINYDILSYLPKNLDSTKGQYILENEFNNAATSILIVENKTDYEIDKLKNEVSKIDGVTDVLSRTSILPSMFPKEILPNEVKNSFYSDNSSLLFVKFDNPAASIETQNAVQKIKDVVGNGGYLSGISPLVKDTRDLTDKETPAYTIIAVILSIIVLVFLTKSTFIPIFFILNIAFAVIYNMGTNFIFGNISYITKAIAVVLQLAVTMDYSIFLYHRYEEERKNYKDHTDAMAVAINRTIISLSGSSFTTIAGFLALVVMQLTLGKDIGLVMVKGVIFGLVTCLTVLPSFMLVFDKLIHKYQHRVFLPKFDKTANFVAKHHLALLIIGLIILPPVIYGSMNYSVYYNLDRSLPSNLDSIVSLNKMKDDYNMQSTHFVIVSTNLNDRIIHNLNSDLKNIKGIKSVLSKASLKGPMIPDNILPDDIKNNFENENYQMIMMQSEFKTASDEVHSQIKEIKEIVKKYDKNGLVTGEAELTDDLTSIADTDFKNVNMLSIGVVFIIILLALKSISLPFILILAIELAIQMNMAVPYYVRETIPFVASIIIGTIQLGSTIDYSILLVTRWIEEIKKGAGRQEAIEITIRETAGSIVTSALSFMVATAGVGFYSKMGIVSVFCNMLARGALLSMLVIIFVLPSIIYFATPLIEKTTFGLKKEM